MHQLQSLDAWNCARDLAKGAYNLTMSAELARHFGLVDQIRRSAASIPANIAEGYGLGTKRQFIRTLRIALGSTYELSSHVQLVADLELLQSEAVGHVQTQCTRQARLLVGLLKSLRATVPH